MLDAMYYHRAASGLALLPRRFVLADQGTGQRDCREKDHKHNRDVEDQFLNASACFKGGTGIGRSKSATQTGSAHLEQNKEDDGYTQDNLDDANRRKPLLQDPSSLSY